MDSKKLYEKMKYENTSNVVSYVLNNIEIGTDQDTLREHVLSIK